VEKELGAYKTKLCAMLQVYTIRMGTILPVYLFHFPTLVAPTDSRFWPYYLLPIHHIWRSPCLPRIRQFSGSFPLLPLPTWLVWLMRNIVILTADSCGSHAVYVFTQTKRSTERGTDPFIR
jgi:hypothetical protein